jgi:hypothetical protein
MLDALELLNEISQEELTDTNTSFPNLSPGQYEFVVDSVEIKDNAAATGKYILFQTKLVSVDAKSTAGDQLSPGYPVRHMINLSPSQKQIDKDPEGLEGCIKKIKQDIAKVVEALVGPSRQYDPSFQLYRGQTFFAKTRVSKERTDERTGATYDPQTEFQTFIPREEDVAAEEINAAYADANPF